MGEGRRFPKWLIGCGAGCGCLVIVAIVLMLLGLNWSRSQMRHFQQAIELNKESDRRFGAVADFTPRADGTIPAERMEAFVAVRERSAEARREIADTLTGLIESKRVEEVNQKRGLEKFRAIADLIGRGVGLGPKIGRFLEARNQAMLDVEMGLGEYTYLYTLSFHSWLRSPVIEGPMNVNERSETLPMSVRKSHTDQARERQSDLLQMLQNQLAALGDDADPEWRAALTAETERMREDRDRLPWQDGLPAQTVAGLEPYRERLTASYQPLTDMFELIHGRDNMNFEYQAK